MKENSRIAILPPPSPHVPRKKKYSYIRQFEKFWRKNMYTTFALLHTKLTDFVHTVDDVSRVLEKKKYLNSSVETANLSKYQSP